jgi:tRNA G18 (ribose-2'-O)-methylase SpoU
MHIILPVKKEVRRSSQTKLDLILILDNVQYARNVAEIFQLAESFRIREIVISGTNPAIPPFGKDLQKASLGSEKVVKWEKTENLPATIKRYRARGYQLLAYSFAEKAKPVGDLVLKNNKVILLVGNETNGLSQELLGLAQQQFYVPTAHRNGFLNLNLSVAIILSNLFVSAK